MKKTLGIAAKIGTQPREMTAADIENAVKIVHQPIQPTPSVVVEAPPPPPRKVRLSVDVTPEEHKKLKIKAVQNDSTIMEYVQRLIQADISL
jgi:hypothetical protein